MNDSRETETDDADEEATARLLRLAGARPPVPSTRAARVRAAVHDRWQAGSRRRAARRRMLTAAVYVGAAAALAWVITNAIRVDRPAVTAGAIVAVVEQIEGAVPGLSVERTVRTGEWIQTGLHARVALRFSDGTSVRLDAASRARPLSSRAVELAAGAVYIDTGRESGRFEVQTAMATARDVGTQFEVRLLDRAVRLRVRAGVVELRDEARSLSGRGGTEITLSATGAQSRPIAAYGSEWDWTARLAPTPDIEGMALGVFLERIAREQGWTLQYADPALAREAAEIILHGSVKGLAPREAVEVAVASSGLRHQLDYGELVVRRGSDAR